MPRNVSSISIVLLLTLVISHNATAKPVNLPKYATASIVGSNSDVLTYSSEYDYDHADDQFQDRDGVQALYRVKRSSEDGSGNIVSGATYQLLNVGSDKVLDAFGPNTQNNANVQIFTNNRGANQIWTIFKNSDGTLKLINPRSKLALDVYRSGTSDGTNVQVHTDSESNAQKWRLKSVGDDQYTLIHVGSGKALDVSGGGTSDETNVQIWSENNTGAQKWRLLRYSDKGNAEEKSLFYGMNAKERELFTLINNHREQNDLPPLQPSTNLAYVARTHAVDIVENNPDIHGGDQHSWSNKGKWKPVRYTPDHAQAALMLSKPSEISNYKSHGYEISIGYTHRYRKTGSVTPKAAVNGWKKSPRHNALMVQKDSFLHTPMRAMGVGIYKGYACAWFGQEIDTFPAPL